MGFGSGQTCWRRLERWQRAGVFDRLPPRGTPLKVITTMANVNDVTQTLVPLDGVPPVAGRPGRPRRRPDSLLGDKGCYDSNPHREKLRKRRTLPVISRKGAPNIRGLGKLRYVVEQTFALLHQFERLAVRWERRTELHDGTRGHGVVSYEQRQRRKEWGRLGRSEGLEGHGREAPGLVER